MLIIDVVSTQELIHYLTPRQGQLDPDTYLITITKPSTQIIIPSKDRIYSEQFTEDSCSSTNAKTLNKFIFQLLDHVQTEWDKDHKLLIHSYDVKGLARGIADYLFSVFPDDDINNLYYNSFDVKKDRDENVIIKIFRKLHTLKEYFSAFGLDF